MESLRRRAAALDSPLEAPENWDTQRLRHDGRGCEPLFFCNFTAPGVQNVASPILKRMFYYVLTEGCPGPKVPSFQRVVMWAPAAQGGGRQINLS